MNPSRLRDGLLCFFALHRWRKLPGRKQRHGTVVEKQWEETVVKNSGKNSGKNTVVKTSEDNGKETNLIATTDSWTKFLIGTLKNEPICYLGFETWVFLV